MSVTTFKNWTVGKGKFLQTTRNVHFDNEGVLTLSPKPVNIYSTTNDANFGQVLAMVYLDASTEYILVTSDGIFSMANTLTVTQLTSSAPSMSNTGDAVAWQDRVYISSTNNVSYWNGSAFTGSIKSTTSGVPHPLCVFENKNSLMVGNGNVVYLLDTSHSTTVTLTLPLEYQVTTIRWKNNVAYIGTRSKNGSTSKMFVWSGAGASADGGGFNASGTEILSLCDYGGSMVAVTSLGQLLRFNGGGFDPLANFPVYYSPYFWGIATGTKRVGNRGMKAEGDLLHLSIDGMVYDPIGTAFGATTYSSRFLYGQPSGLWTYDPKVGLYPRSLTTTDTYTALTATALATNELTLSSDTKLTTGEPVLLKTLGSLTGLKAGIVYYAIIENPFSNKLKLAATPNLARQGTALTIGGSVTSAVFWVLNYSSLGQTATLITNNGAVEVINEAFQIPALFYSTLMWAGGLLATGSTSTNTVNVGSKGYNVGSFTTNRIDSPNQTTSFQKVVVKYNELNLDNEELLVKTKKVNRPDYPSNLMYGTYTSDTVITSTSLGIEDIEAGEEITIVTGDGEGHVRQIVTNTSGTITVSEAIPIVGSGDVCVFYSNNFSLIKTIDNSNQYGFEDVPIAGDASKFLQLKTEIRGAAIEVEELQLSTEKQV